MRKLAGMIVIGGVLLAASFATAQRPGGGSNPGNGDDLVDRMMAFDKNDDGKLSRTEVTDQRLLRLFDRADADKDGTVTKQELATLASQEPAVRRGGPGGFGPPGGPGGGPMMGAPRPGEILPAMLQRRLNLTPVQKNEVDALQKEVDTKLDKILTKDQKAQLKQMRERGPGGFGPPSGGRGPGRFGSGPPPGGPGGPPPGDRPPPGGPPQG